MGSTAKAYFLLLDSILFYVIFLGEVQERHPKYAWSSFRSPNLVFRPCFESQQDAQRSKWAVCRQLSLSLLCGSLQPLCLRCCWAHLLASACPGVSPPWIINLLKSSGLLAYVPPKLLLYKRYVYFFANSLISFKCRLSCSTTTLQSVWVRVPSAFLLSLSSSLSGARL